MTGRIHDEAELIETYLSPLTRRCPTAFGLKDDAALIEIEEGNDLVVSTDPVIAGEHFFAGDPAADIAWKALAVNISDLVAKGAEPVAYTMALAFPEAPKHAWMAEFAGGLALAQDAFGTTLVGGDTDRTSGPLSISITAFGVVPREAFVPRGGARAGDHVFVTGTLGDAALGLRLHWDGAAFDGLPPDLRAHLVARYLRPCPRQALVPVLRTYATAALDVSDGFAKDLARIAAGANAGLDIAFDMLPLSAAARAVKTGSPLAVEKAVLTGGDDYEIIFAVTAGDVAAMRAAAEAAGVAITEVGVLHEGAPVRFLASDGSQIAITAAGYDHFA